MKHNYRLSSFQLARFFRLPRLSLACVLAFVISGCSHIDPWVSPYERNYLSDPVMSFASDPIDASFMHHVHQAREGARGAEGGGGGGCGCN